MEKILEAITMGFFFTCLIVVGLVLLYLVFRLMSYAVAKSWVQVTTNHLKQNGGVNNGKEEEEEKLISPE